MKDTKHNFRHIIEKIRKSGLNIYDIIETNSNELLLDNKDLELILNESLLGFKLAGLPLRTRSKIIKQKICEVLGYPLPLTFKRTQPKFPGQNFDIYIQKSNNLQIWNEEIAPQRRYVLIRVNEYSEVTRVKVINGVDLILYDTTGTLTQKYQARVVLGDFNKEICVSEDTDNLKSCIPFSSSIQNHKPTDFADEKNLLSINNIFTLLSSLIGKTFKCSGIDQERKRGAILHNLVCECLGYKEFCEDGRFPDIQHQLLEIKLQTSPTIDLGRITPESQQLLDVPSICDKAIRICDVRFAIFFGHKNGEMITLTHLIMTTGAKFFDRFPRFGGRVINRKLQLPLPFDFFDR